MNRQQPRTRTSISAIAGLLPDRRTPGAFLATFLLTLALGGAIAPTAAADGVEGGPDRCSKDNSGWGTETASCDYNCDANQHLSIYANVDDAGTIKGGTACGGAGAPCPASTSSCKGDSFPTRTAHQDIGSCWAQGDGGWWTRVYVSCSAQDAGGDTVPGTGGVELDPDELTKLICEQSNPARCVPNCNEVLDAIMGTTAKCTIEFLPDNTKFGEVIMALVKNSDGTIDKLGIICGVDCVTFDPFSDVEDGIQRLSSCRLPATVDVSTCG